MFYWAQFTVRGLYVAKLFLCEGCLAKADQDLRRYPGCIDATPAPVTKGYSCQGCKREGE